MGRHVRIGEEGRRRLEQHGARKGGGRVGVPPLRIVVGGGHIRGHLRGAYPEPERSVGATCEDPEGTHRQRPLSDLAMNGVPSQERVVLL